MEPDMKQDSEETQHAESGNSSPKTLAQRKAGTTCTRCGEQRWPFKNWIEPYVCQRCREVLAGGNAIDPLPSEAQRKARAVAGERLSTVGMKSLLAWRAIQASRRSVATPIAGASEGPQSSAIISATSNRIKGGLAGQPGRPRVPKEEQRRKDREWDRAHRQRQTKQGVAE